MQKTQHFLRRNSILLSLFFVFFSIQKSKADCTVTASINSSNFLATYGGCTGTLTIPTGVVLTMDAALTMPAAINRIVIKNGGQIAWTNGNNLELRLAQNTSIVIENKSTTMGTLALGGACNNNNEIYIGAVQYAVCVGGGACIKFATLIANGGTIQIDPAVIVNGTSQNNNNVCFNTFSLNVAINGFVHGTPAYSWTQTSGPGTSTFSASSTIQNPTITVTQPGSYTYKVEVTVSFSETCLTTLLTVNSSINIVVLPTQTASVTAGTSPICIGATSTFANTGDQTGTWASDNMAIATVDLNTGIVTGVTVGIANISYNIITGCGAPITDTKPISIISCSLPINLLLFKGEETKLGNKILWETSSETNFSHFDLEKSVNSKAFHSITILNGSNTKEKNSYQFYDKNTFGGAYYRLKMIDLDGTIEYSKVIFVETNNELSKVGDFYPNPSLTNEVAINITNANASNWTITSYDLSGRLIKTESRFLDKGENKVRIDLNESKSGISIFRFENADGVLFRKLNR